MSEWLLIVVFCLSVDGSCKEVQRHVLEHYGSGYGGKWNCDRLRVREQTDADMEYAGRIGAFNYRHFDCIEHKLEPLDEKRTDVQS